jgi:hypothetical protein
MTRFDNEGEAELPEEEEEEGPIGVILTANVIVETDDHDLASDVAQGVVNELNQAIDEEKISVNIRRTSDHFYPEDYE